MTVPYNIPEIKDEIAIMGMRRACQLARRVLDRVGKEATVSLFEWKTMNLALNLTSY